MTLTDDQRIARAELSRFSPERPLIVPPSLYARMRLEPSLADLMDRVVVSRPLPLVPTRH